MMYGAVTDGGNHIAALDLSKIAERNLRKQVDYQTSHPVGTIIVDPYTRYLYLVQPGGKAMRYSVGVGRAGLTFSGEAQVAYKAQWPRWTPTQNMIKRHPDHYAKYAMVWKAAFAIRSARVRSIFIAMARTRFIASMAPTNPGQSARLLRRAVSVFSIRTFSIFINAYPVEAALWS